MVLKLLSILVDCIWPRKIGCRCRDREISVIVSFKMIKIINTVFTIRTSCPWTKLCIYLAFWCRSVWLQSVSVRQWQEQQENNHKDERDSALHLQLNCSWLLWTNVLSATLHCKTGLWTTTTTFFYSFHTACLNKTGTSFQWPWMCKRLAALSCTWQITCNAFNA